MDSLGCTGRVFLAIGAWLNREATDFALPRLIEFDNILSVYGVLELGQAIHQAGASTQAGVSLVDQLRFGEAGLQTVHDIGPFDTREGLIFSVAEFANPFQGCFRHWELRECNT